MNILEDYYNKTLDDHNYKPSESEEEKIVAIISSFTDEDLLPSIEVFQNYYSIKVPNNIIREMFKKDFTLAYENISKGVYDTYARDLLIESLLAYMQINYHWPFISSSKDYTKKFLKEFKAKCKEFNVVKL